MNKRSRKRWIAAGVAVLLCGAGTYGYLHIRTAEPAAAATAQTVMKASKGAISSTISGTSQLAAKDMQNVTLPAGGTVQTMNLTQNQAVKQGDVLVQLSSPSLEASLKEAEVSLQQMEKDLADLQAQRGHMALSAPIGGKLTLAGNLEVGSPVSKGAKVATLADPSQLKVKLPFALQDAVQLKTGDEVELTVDGYLLTKVGTVTAVGREVTADASGGKLVDVEIAVVSDGTLDAGMKVSGTADIGGLEVASAGEAALDYVTTAAVYAEASGTIRTLPLQTGDTAAKGQTIATLGNDDLADTIASKQAAIDSQRIKVTDAQQKVDQLTITAPFDGVFSADFANSKSNVLNNYPVGTQVTEPVTLGAVASLSTMQLAIAVDELDLTSVKVGQQASVKVDALSGKTFAGEVTSLSNVGTTTNGVTTYDAVISIPNTAASDLKYAMTATAEIFIQDKKDILVVPIQAVQTQKGQTYVALKKADGTVEEQHEIQIGIRSQTQVEVVSGLSEGDEIVMPARKSATQNQQQMPGGFPGGGPEGGGFPGGGGFGGGQGGNGGGGGFGGGGRN